MFSSKPPAVCLSVKLCVSLHVVMWKCGVSTYRWGTGSGFPHNLSIRDRSTENCWVLLMSSCVSFCQPSSSHHHHHHHHHRHDHQQAGESQSIQTHPIHIRFLSNIHNEYKWLGTLSVTYMCIYMFRETDLWLLWFTGVLRTDGDDVNDVLFPASVSLIAADVLWCFPWDYSWPGLCLWRVSKHLYCIHTWSLCTGHPLVSVFSLIMTPDFTAWISSQLYHQRLIWFQ